MSPKSNKPTLHETRTTRALVYVGDWEYFDKLASDPPADLKRFSDRTIDRAVRELFRRFPITIDGLEDRPVIGRCHIGGLVFDLTTKKFICGLKLICEYLTNNAGEGDGFWEAADIAWEIIIKGSDYPGTSFTTQSLRGLVASRLESCRPDQVRVTFLNSSEAEIRDTRQVYAKSITIPPVGWDRETAAEFKRQYVDAQFRRRRRKT